MVAHSKFIELEQNAIAAAFILVKMQFAPVLPPQPILNEEFIKSFFLPKNDENFSPEDLKKISAIKNGLRKL